MERTAEQWATTVTISGFLKLAAFIRTQQQRLADAEALLVRVAAANASDTYGPVRDVEAYLAERGK